jgi:hypothetical protein
LIRSEIVPIKELITRLSSNESNAISISPCFKGMIENLREDLWCFIEAPYVDRIYRDAYYNYYSSKLAEYNRNCLRVSFFNQPIQKDLFYSQSGHQELEDNFLGFTVLRIPPHIQNPGRTALSPKAFKKKDFICELAPIKATVGGVKVSVDAFPFSSQDGECMTCAETSIWAVMEYYGNKYAERKLILPSEIHKAFQRDTRILPSEGLSVMEIASALTHFGFGTHLYWRKRDPNGKENPIDAEMFRRNLFYYIESGIPVILGLQNGNNVGHAVAAIGHENISSSEILSSIKNKTNPETANECIDTADIRRKLILIDDNCPPYIAVEYEKPCSHYSGADSKDYMIDYYIVPLYHRIYLDAGKASKLLSNLIVHPKLGWKKLSSKGSQSVIKRIFLTTCNSYKSFVLQSDMDSRIKELIQMLLLPKFIWIAELSTPEIYLSDKACGLILLDATGSNRLESIKMLLYPGLIDFDYGNFSIYRNNLKGA